MNAHTRNEALTLARAAARLAGRAVSVALNVGLIAGVAYILGARVTDAPTAILAFMAAAFGLSGGFLPPRRRVVITGVDDHPYARHVDAALLTVAEHRRNTKDGTP